MRKFLILLILTFGLLFAQLFRLTILEGKRYRALSSGQRIRERKISAPRGLIKDRNGEVLVRNRPVYKKSSKLTEEEYEIISHEEAIEIEAKGEGASLKVEVVREYPYGEVLAHLIGYTGEVSNEEIKNYKIGDIVGRMGVEEEYDSYLRGVDGQELIETDAKGKALEILGKIEPIPGKDLNLSIDLSLQKKVSQLLKDKKGAVVVSNPGNGEILALYSSPSFDPNFFVDPQFEEEREKILSDLNKPLFNRAISGLYPPGSIFKIITAAAALEEKVIDQKTKIEDVGVIQIGPYRFPNWYFTQYGRREGMVDIIKAIKRSNDIFFYKVGEALGIGNLKKWAEKFGIGKVLGIDLPGEAEGLVPDPNWKKRVKKEAWFLGDTYHLSIGQGNLLVTPLQVNFWTEAIANGGRVCKPRIAKWQMENIKSKERETCQEIGLKKETIKLIKEGMRQACEPGGTGWPLFKFKIRSSKLKIDNKNFLDAGEGMIEIPTGCKTGTAEFSPSTSSGQGRTHAWFTVFAPFYDPEIVVTVLIEGGGEGSYVAAPIAKEILKAWFEK